MIAPFELTRQYERKLCSVCEVIWCSSMKYDESKSTNTCIKAQSKNNGVGICHACTRNTKSPSISTVLQSPTYNNYYIKNHRLCNPEHEISSLVEQFPSEQQLTDIISNVEATYMLKKTQPYPNFPTMRSAKIYFSRMFSYLHYKKENDVNLFEFHAPKCCSSIVDTHDKQSYLKLHLDKKALNTLYDKCWLNDVCIDLFMVCLNLVTISKCSSRVVPEFLFGSTQDQKQVIPDPDMYPFIHSYLSTPKGEETADLCKNCIDEVELWYCNERKNRVSIILDAYGNLKIKNYVTCVNVRDNHWIVLRVALNDEKSPYVTTYDSKRNDNDAVNKMYRLWYAKFFALYLKEKDKGMCNRNDFNIESLKDMKNNEIDISKGTMIAQYRNNDGKCFQKDNYNCGIFCLRRCFEFIGIQMEHIACDDPNETYRLKYLSLIAKVYESLNLDRYKQLQDHIYMQFGDPLNVDQVKRFGIIHELFNKENDDKYVLNMETKNANTIFNEEININDLSTKLHVLNKAVKKNERKKKLEPILSESVLSESEVPEKRTKLSIVPPVSISVGENAPVYYLKTLVLSNLQHNRINPLYDFSDNRIVLKVETNDNDDIIDNDDSWFKTLSDDDKERITYDPSDTVAGIKQFFIKSYKDKNGNKLEEEEKDKFSKLIEKLMVLFITYCVFDLKMVGNKYHYVVTGAFILEPYFDHDKKWCSIIHMFATTSKNKDQKQIQVLLNKSFQNIDMQNHTVYVLTDIGNICCHRSAKAIFIESYFKELGGLELLELQRELYGSISDDTGIMTGVVSKLTNATSKYRNYGLGKAYSVHGYITNYKKKYYRVSSDGELQFYTPGFKWTNALDFEKKLVSIQKYNIAWKEKGSIYQCKNMYGSRTLSNSGSHALSHKKDAKPISPMFQHATHHRENSCCWLTFALLVNVSNPVVACQLIEYYKKDYDRFEWLTLTKVNRDILYQEQQHGHDTLQAIVQKEIKCGYHLKRKKHSHGMNCHLNFLLDSDSTGLFLCVLKARMVNGTHVIGINCSSRIIYDCEESFELELTRDNIDHCCGVNSGGIAAITTCFEIIEQPKKQKNQK